MNDAAQNDAWNALMASKEAFRAEAAHHLFEKLWLRAAAERVVKAWEHAHIGNEPMIDALVDLRDALALSRPHQSITEKLP